MEIQFSELSDLFSAEFQSMKFCGVWRNRKMPFYLKSNIIE